MMHLNSWIQMPLSRKIGTKCAHTSFKRPHNHFLEMTLKIFEKSCKIKFSILVFFLFLSSNNHCVLLQTFMNSSFLAFSKFANPVTICISNGFIQLHTLWKIQLFVRFSRKILLFVKSHDLTVWKIKKFFCTSDFTWNHFLWI